MISRVLMRLDNAYPSAQDRADIESYLATAKARRAALGEVRRVVQTVCEEVIDRQRAVYPQFGRHRSAGFEKGLRDMILLTQMAANAMFLGEHATLDDQFTIWYKTILKSVHLPPQFMRDTFGFWHQSLEKHLSPDAYALLRPHAEHLSETLSDLPVPARDETGSRQMATAR